MATAPAFGLKRRIMTVSQYMAMPVDENKYELYDGELVMSPSYNFGHGAAAGHVFSKLYSFVSKRDLGLVGQETDVIMPEFRTVLRPDICFISRSRLRIIRGHIHGPPDLVVELTSPGNREYDLVLKRDFYERFGVREYWALDIAERRECAYQWHAKGGRLAGGPVEKAAIKSIVLKGFQLKLPEVWKAAAVGYS